MANQFPCPNPACTHVFALADLQAAAQVQCPRCGFRLQGSAAAAKPAAAPPRPAIPASSPIMQAKPARPLPAQAPVARPPAAAAPARPSRPVVPVAAPVSPPPAQYSPNDIDVELVDPATAAPTAAPVQPLAAPVFGDGLPTGPRMPPRTARRGPGRGLTKVLILVGVLMTFGCVILTTALLVANGVIKLSDAGLKGFSGDGKPRQIFTGYLRNLKEKEEKVFKVTLPKEGWVSDKELRTRLSAVAAWKHTKEDLWFAVSVKDYGMQKPRDSELVQQALDKLEQHFGDAVEMEAKTEPAEIAGQPSRKLTFKGTLGTVVWWGECYMFAYHGFGYWVFVAAPTIQELRDPLEELKRESALTLLTERQGWREQPLPTKTFTSADKVFTMTAPGGVWNQHDQPNVEYDSGVLYLFGEYRKEQDNTKNAHFQVFKMEAQPDAKEAIKSAEMLIDKHKQDENTKYKLVPAKNLNGALPDVGAQVDVGPNPGGRLAELALLRDEKATRYYLLAVVTEQGSTYVILGDCSWQSRQIWEQDFRDMLKTFRVQKKAE